MTATTASYARQNDRLAGVGLDVAYAPATLTARPIRTVVHGQTLPVLMSQVRSPLLCFSQ